MLSLAGNILMPVQLRRIRLMVTIGVALLVTGCRPPETESIVSPGDAPSPKRKASLTESQREHIVEFCADCHALPLASSFPKKAWHEEVQRGFDFYFASDDKRLEPPVFNDVVTGSISMQII